MTVTAYLFVRELRFLRPLTSPSEILIFYLICPHCHQPFAALSLIVNINENMDSERLVEAVRMRPMLYESSSKCYKDADKKAPAWKEMSAEQLEVTGRCDFNIH